MYDLPTAKSQPGAGPAEPADRRLDGLRGTAFAVLVMLVVQYGLGTWLNLYAKLPGSDHGRPIFAAFAAAVASGPTGLTLHALLGLLLIVASVTFVVRAAVANHCALVVIGLVGLLATVSAAISGARFVATGDEATSLAMAVATGVALLACGVALLVLARPQRGPDRPQRAG